MSEESDKSLSGKTLKDSESSKTESSYPPGASMADYVKCEV